MACKSSLEYSLRTALLLPVYQLVIHHYISKGRIGRNVESLKQLSNLSVISIFWLTD